jgi:NAD(P)-dependent dehydrogenase (short-subunit alcohol dehydrogenase family)
MTLARDIDEDRTMQRLKDRVAVITGAARGIGRGIALCMAAEGADIVLNDLPPDAPGVVDARATAADIEAIGRRALVVYGDVADRDAVDQVFAAAIEQFGRVDIAVANAAFSIRELVVEAQWEHVLRTIEVTQFGRLSHLPRRRRATWSRAAVLAKSSLLVRSWRRFRCRPAQRTTWQKRRSTTWHRQWRRNWRRTASM